MKHKKYILLSAILACTVVWFLFRKSEIKYSRQENPVTNVLAVTNPTTQIRARNSVARQPSAAVVTTNYSGSPSPINSSNSSDTMTRYRQGLINKGEAIQETLMEQNRKSLDMYGKVVDQYGQPVVGAKVEGGILLNVSLVSSGSERHYTVTDTQGCFSFIGIHGVGLGIYPQKEGYMYNFRLPSQRPDNYQPDPNNPIVFNMWKIKGAEPLENRSINSEIPCDGTPAVFDTTTGNESSSGDLRVALLRSPLQVRRSGQGFDWSAKIEMLHGGLIEEDAPYPYWAPESGYEPFFQINMSSNNVSWFSKLTRDFYIKNGRGQYGRMLVTVYSALTPARIKCDFIINPSGSQNLEPASVK
jgi:hypothetical protein